MTLGDPVARTRLGAETQQQLGGKVAAEPRTPFEASWRDYVFAEVWNRPALDRRSRFWIAITGAACGNGPGDILEGYMRGALTSGAVTLSELLEGALHLAVYAGWSAGARWDAAALRVAEELGVPNTSLAPIRAEPWDPAERLADGAAGFAHVMTFGGPPPVTPYFEGGILNFVFAEMWNRPGLDQRARRWITLVGVAESSSEVPIQSHVYGAMNSGNATLDEMQEFVLAYALHGGWPRASVVQGAVFEQGRKVAEGLPFS